MRIILIEETKFRLQTKGIRTHAHAHAHAYPNKFIQNGNQKIKQILFFSLKINKNKLLTTNCIANCSFVLLNNEKYE